MTTRRELASNSSWPCCRAPITFGANAWPLAGDRRNGGFGIGEGIGGEGRDRVGKASRPRRRIAEETGTGPEKWPRPESRS